MVSGATSGSGQHYAATAGATLRYDPAAQLG